MAEPFHCDFSNHLFMGHLGNAMLNAADFHSNDRGYGMNFLNTIHKTWVLSRLAIEVTEMPRSYDQFCIETWVEGVMRYFTSRNFAVTSRDGSQTYGYGRSIWAMIDTDTRQPTDLLQLHDGLIVDYVETSKPCPIAKSSRVKMDDAARLMRRLDTYYHDVDINGHINSVKYIEHVLDLWDMEWYRNHRLCRFEIAYVAESHQGDVLSFYVEEEPSADAAISNYCVRITKRDREADVETETVRAKVCFAKL